MRRIPRSGVNWVGILIGVLVLAVVVAILYPVFAPRSGGRLPQNICMNNQRQLAMAIMVYAQDHGEVLPLPKDWVEASKMQSDPKLFDCPTNKYQGSPGHPDYGMNAFLYEMDVKNGKKQGTPLGKIDDPTIVELTADINGPTEAIPQTLDGRLINPFPKSYTVAGYFGSGANADCRHGKATIVSYVDGHVIWVHPEELSATGRTRYNIPIGKKPGQTKK